MLSITTQSLPLLESGVNEIVRCVLCFVSLLSLSRVILQFVQIVARVSGSFLVSAEPCSVPTVLPFFCLFTG